MSIIKANKWQSASGDTFNSAIQVVVSRQGTTSTTSDTGQNNNASYAITTTTSTWTNSTFTLTITPRFSNSLIKLQMQCFAGAEGTDNAVNYRIVRGSTVIWQPQTNSSGPYGGGYFSSSFSAFHPIIMAYDQPNTTSPVTYTVQYRVYNTFNGNCYAFGYPGTSQWAAVNTFTATEYIQ